MTAVAKITRPAFLLALALLLLIGGCARMPSTGITSIKAANQAELQQHLLSHRADVDLFRSRGPFAVDMQKDRSVPVAGGSVAADLFLAAPAGKGPLVILLHGLGNSKADHGYQAKHLATWGMHSLAVQLPNDGSWVDNGKALAQIADAIRRQPELLDGRIDATRIVLAGHSYGGSATAIALAEGAPAIGGVLLDPAGIGKELPGYLRKISKPVIVVASDPKVSVTNDRAAFFRFVRRGIAEVSIKGAAHEDAEYPLELDFTDDEDMQIAFVSALTASAFSLAYTGGVDYAWSSFIDAVKSGKLMDPRKK